MEFLLKIELRYKWTPKCVCADAAQDSTFPLLVKFTRSIWRWHWYTVSKSDAKAASRCLQKRRRANSKHHTEKLSCKYLTRHKYQKWILAAGGWFRKKIRITSSSLFSPLNKHKIHQAQRSQVPVTRNTAWAPVFFSYSNDSYKQNLLKITEVSLLFQWAGLMSLLLTPLNLKRCTTKTQYFK